MVRVPKWPERCSCHPGSEQNGWHQVWSPECLQVEREVWASLLRRYSQQRCDLSPAGAVDQQGGRVLAVVTEPLLPLATGSERMI